MPGRRRPENRCCVRGQNGPKPGLVNVTARPVADGFSLPSQGSGPSLPCPTLNFIGPVACRPITQAFRNDIIWGHRIRSFAFSLQWRHTFEESSKLILFGAVCAQVLLILFGTN
jgi:hypothetical protein